MMPRHDRQTTGPVAPHRAVPRSMWEMLAWNHIKLWTAILVGVAVALLLPAQWSILSRVLTGWNITIVTLVPLVVIWSRQLSARELRALYEEDDPTAWVILLAVVAAALLSLVAIVGLLATVRHASDPERIGHFALACLTIVDSWLLVHTMFTMHYADLYYSVQGEETPPLDFPQTREPLFWDFVYFSFTIAVACQTADVATTQTAMRRSVIFHSVVAFVFNMAVLGLAVNVSAGLLA